MTHKRRSARLWINLDCLVSVKTHWHTVEPWICTPHSLDDLQFMADWYGPMWIPQWICSTGLDYMAENYTHPTSTGSGTHPEWEGPAKHVIGRRHQPSLTACNDCSADGSCSPHAICGCQCEAAPAWPALPYASPMEALLISMQGYWADSKV